jgi:alkylated DNA repair protein (DNA oxidative demethylase)
MFRSFAVRCKRSSAANGLMTNMLDLFDTPSQAGLSAAPNLVTKAEERSLIAAINATDLTPFRLQGWTGKRLTSSFGWHYDFDNGQVARTAPIPDWLLPIRERMAVFARLEPETLIQALLIRYDPGAGIGWHRDRPIYEHVLGLSLGAPAEMRFRRRRGERAFERMSLPLDPRAAYHIAGEARHEWEHSIVEIDRARWSITFRSASEKARSVFA